jgi:hypothetical protein
MLLYPYNLCQAPGRKWRCPIRVWWVPYFFGPSKAWQAAYDRLHSQTIKVLPARGLNPIPNLEHMILNVLTLVTAITTLFAFVL